MKRPVLYLATDQRIFQEKKFMKDGENGFFREATLRLCSSLDVEKALFNCLSYLKNSLPAFEMLLTILDLRLGLIHNLAAVDLEGVKKPFPPKTLSEEAVKKISRDIDAWQDVKILDQLDLHPAAYILFQDLDISTTAVMYMNLVIEGGFWVPLFFWPGGKGGLKITCPSYFSTERTF